MLRRRVGPVKAPTLRMVTKLTQIGHETHGIPVRVNGLSPAAPNSSDGGWRRDGLAGTLMGAELGFGIPVGQATVASLCSPAAPWMGTRPAPGQAGLALAG